MLALPEIFLAAAGMALLHARRRSGAARPDAADRLAGGAGAGRRPAVLRARGRCRTRRRRPSAACSSSTASRVFMKVLVLLGAALAIIMSLDYIEREGMRALRVPGADPVRHARHDDDGLGQRPDRALSRPRAAEPGALRRRRLPPRSTALDRGRPEVLRPRRAVLGHAALRRLAGLRLRRHDHLRRPGQALAGSRRRRSPSASSSASSSSSPAWPSRSRPCRSTCGRPTSTRARRRRSPPSSPSRPRSRRSACSCASWSGRSATWSASGSRSSSSSRSPRWSSAPSPRSARPTSSG